MQKRHSASRSVARALERVAGGAQDELVLNAAHAAREVVGVAGDGGPGRRLEAPEAAPHALLQRRLGRGHHVPGERVASQIFLPGGAVAAPALHCRPREVQVVVVVVAHVVLVGRERDLDELEEVVVAHVGV